MAIVKSQKPQTDIARVGNSIGERRAFLQGHGGVQAPQKSVGQPLDQFSGTVSARPEEVRHASNAVFGGTWARVTSDTPLKKPIHDSLERGRQKPVAGKRPSDNAILNFLNRVITADAQRAPAPTAAPAAQRTVAARAQVVAPKVAAAPQARPQVRPATAAAQAPRPQVARPIAQAPVRQTSPSAAGIPTRRVAPQAAIPPRPAAAPIAAQRFAAQAPVVRPQVRKA